MLKKKKKSHKIVNSSEFQWDLAGLLSLEMGLSDCTFILFTVGVVLRAAGHQGSLHQPGEGLSARDHLHCGAKAPSHTPVLR